MIFFRSFQHRRVKRKLKPLYTCIMQDIVTLNRIKLGLDELMLTGLGDDDDEDESDEVASELPDVSQLPDLANWIAGISTPSNSYSRSLRSGLGLVGRHVVPHRRQAIVACHALCANLDTLRDRISLSDASICTAEAGRSRLQASVEYYEMVLRDIADAFAQMSHGRGKRTAGKQVRALLREAAIRVKDYASLPQPVIDQFSETDYLSTHPDIKASVARGSQQSGLQHFAVNGYAEILNGTRPSGTFFSTVEDSVESRAHGLVFEEDPAVNETSHADEINSIDSSRLFDSQWYQQQYAAAATYEGGALKHYVDVGEATGYWPNVWFDAPWYAKTHKLSLGGGAAFAHYCESQLSAHVNPNEHMDSDYYFKMNIDLHAYGLKPVEHFYAHGWKEQRSPSADFEITRYIQKKMFGDTQRNPITHCIQKQRSLKLFANAIEQNVPSIQFRKERIAATLATIHASAAATVVDDGSQHSADAPVPNPVEVVGELPDVASNIKYFANPGPNYENPSRVNCETLKPRAKTIAYFLPQFYAFEQNDEWWGEGFTEWRNVSRGTPRYAGHYQPRIPRDLGFYDLTNVDSLKAQAKLAQQNGIEAFCFYYYWFNGTRLMDKPLDLFLDADIDQEFCIMWANENWTRTWDGFDSEVLIRQDYCDEDEDAFIADTAQYLGHERYVRVDGRPLFVLYRPGLLPNAAETIARWKDKWTEVLGVTPWVLMVQGFEDMDPREYDLDGAVEFPPHKVTLGTQDINDQLTVIDPAFAGHVRSYADVVDSALNETTPDFPLIKTVSPSWDNDARREGRGMTLHGSTPELYEKWLRGAIEHAVDNPFAGESLVFINAWNEWAESAYLEPDVHYGHAYLNATKRAVHNLTSAREQQSVLLVGHDACQHGAQMLLLSYAKIYREQFGLDVVIALKEGGPLVKKYERFGKTIVLEQHGMDELLRTIQDKNVDIAVCNTTVTGDVVPFLKYHGLRVVSLIHELPNLIEEYKLGDNVKAIAKSADHVVFAAEMVKSGFQGIAKKIKGDARIMPQGSYKIIEFNDRCRTELRRELGLGKNDKMVLNVGFADLRKGFDLFLQHARQLCAEDKNLHFVWAGALAPEMERWVKADLGHSSVDKRIHLIGFTDRMSDYYSACDALFLTSREDPYPTVVLEAMAVGAPVVIFKDTTGFDSLMSEYGYVADRSDSQSVRTALQSALYDDSEKQKSTRSRYVDKHCRFDDYVFDILRLLLPDLKKVSVVVPNYNYEQYMPARLGSVFNQTYPIFETIVLDDGSTDKSLKVIEKFSDDSSRIVNLVPSAKNSGNTFKQWRKGLELCRGDFVWIAEADDLSEASFISESVQTFDDNTVMSYTDSAQIQTDDKLLAKSYDYYFNTVDKELFSGDFNIAGEEFVQRALSVKNVILNVSAVVWRRDSLRAALTRIGDPLLDYKLVGDWRLYLEVLLSEKARIAYLADSLNTHRRHQGSVTHQMDHRKHLNEIQSIHQFVLDNTRLSVDTEAEIAAYVRELEIQFGMVDADSDESSDDSHRQAA